MDPSKPVPPSVRLQELLAVPDRDRTEEEWDELIELEITLAPENRSRKPGRNDGPHHPGPASHAGAPGNSGNRRGNKRPGKKRNFKDKMPR